MTLKHAATEIAGPGNKGQIVSAGKCIDFHFPALPFGPAFSGVARSSYCYMYFVVLYLNIFRSCKFGVPLNMQVHRYIDLQPPQDAGCSELVGQSGVSGPALCQCHRFTSTAPLASSLAKNQLQACRHHIQYQLNQDSGLPVRYHSRIPSYTHSAIC